MSDKAEQVADELIRDIWTEDGYLTSVDCAHKAALEAYKRGVADARRFAKHDALCGIVGGYNQCTCGFSEVFEND